MNTHEIEELKKCADPVTGPAYFIQNYFHIQHPVRGSILLNPFDYQLELIDSYITNRFSMNLIARQMGKTAVSAGYILWNAMFTADQNIVVGGNKLATAKEIIHRVLYGYDNCPDFLKEKLLVRNKMELGFANGSNIYAQTVNPCMGRGHSISLLYLDEFSYVNSADAKQAWQSIRPSLSASSQVIINSSANEQDNFFTTMWEEACNGETKFVTMNIDWKRHPAHDQNWAYEMVACMGVDRFKIEYENRLAA